MYNKLRINELKNQISSEKIRQKTHSIVELRFVELANKKWSIQDEYIKLKNAS